MKQPPARLKDLLDPVIAGLGYEAVGYAFDTRTSILRMYIDRPEGITLDDCERVSHQVSGVLDVENPIPGAYRLEVSSPGLDRPLFTPEHFQRFVGHEARVQTRLAVGGRKNFRGRILAADEGQVLLDVEGVQQSFPFAGIDKANLVPELAVCPPHKKRK